MSPLIIFYITSWLLLTIISLILLIKERKNLIIFKKDYINFLFKRWKIIIFFIAAFGLSYISTFEYDPSWDILETVIMSILTFYLSPYTVGILYRFYKGISNSKKELYISITLMFFASCWFYDIYASIFLLGYYTPMAFSNLFLSPFFYLFAGLMWSLDYSKKDGVIFVYTKDEWIYFKGDSGSFSKILIYITPIVIFMIIVFGYFIYLNL